MFDVDGCDLAAHHRFPPVAVNLLFPLTTLGTQLETQQPHNRFQRCPHNNKQVLIGYLVAITARNMTIDYEGNIIIINFPE